MGSGMNHSLLKVLAPCILASLPLLVAGCSGAPTEDTGSSGSAYSESGNEKAAFEFFVSKGLTEDQAAGIVGNLIQESNVNPSISQYGGGPGRGIAQWSAGGRWDSDYRDNVVWYAASKGMSRYSLTLQLDFIWYELTVKGYGYNTLHKAPDVTDATIDFEVDFEGCGQCDQGTRIAYAQQVLAAFGGHGGGGGGGGGGTSADACNKGGGFCTETLQCDGGHWIIRQDDPAACSSIENVEEPCHEGGGYCTATLQCDGGHWVPRSDDPNACTSGPGA
jgi:Phage tail lysozyme